MLSDLASRDGRSRAGSSSLGPRLHCGPRPVPAVPPPWASRSRNPVLPPAGPSSHRCCREGAGRVRVKRGGRTRREPLGWGGLRPEVSPWTGAAPLYPLIVKCQSLSLVRFSATPWTVPRQDPLSMGFSRQEYWSALPCPSPGDLPNPGTEPRSLKSPAWVDGFLTS